jgi:hypothetical protein
MIRPPKAARKGNAALRKVESSPTRNSRLISRPTTKKKSDMRPSLIQWWRFSVTTNGPNPTVSGVSSKLW